MQEKNFAIKSKTEFQNQTELVNKLGIFLYDAYVL